MKFGEWLKEKNKVLFSAKSNDGTFQVVARDTAVMKGVQDKFMMQLVHKGKILKLGSHPSLEGAKGWFENNKDKLLKHSEIFQ